MKLLKNISLYAVCTILSLQLASCTLFSPTPKAPINKKMTGTAREQQTRQIKNWQASGAISISFNNKTDVGSFDWTQRGLNYTFQTYGPLNLGGVSIQGRPGFVTLNKSSKRTTARSPEQLMQQELGWYLPLSNLRYWCRGLPAPGIKSVPRYDQFGHLRLLRQQGWSISYKKYQAVSGQDLPRTIVFGHQNLRVKVVIRSWQI